MSLLKNVNFAMSLFVTGLSFTKRCPSLLGRTGFNMLLKAVITNVLKCVMLGTILPGIGGG